MSINNNRPFFRDSITDGWTKKDWALNLIPLGGIASVAYEIGSACLSSRDRTAKISEDFFKSPIQTTLKKIAQCLWVPIVACGVLKLVCFIVKACWNRCFPPANNRPREESQVIDPRAKDPCIIIPPEVVVNHIFSYLNLHELGVSRSVSRTWNQCASVPILWQSAIYREIAFSSKNWAEWNTDLVKDVDMRQEMLSLPKNIAEELRRSAFPGKSIRETHVLVRMPKGLTIKKLGELAKKYFPSNTDGYRYIWPAIVDKSGDKAVDESVWLLMTKDVLQGSRSKSYSQQKNIVAELAETTGVPYQVPTTLEAATCILAEYSRSENRLFSDSPWTYTRCQENVQGFQMDVGGFAPAGLSVYYDHYVSGSIGVAALRKF
ncbi:putative uncharacterized protein [Parachlamydia acanthamoebae UV-7]|uniref:F-box domain-containing protein n=1 Tax=Parachlamydia acanthamoebae (strain UV7) TaxID=765952 RepID=F8KZL2_PARAV|nr:F-box protein [Parachlamydia acanthamoebae]CCB86352.1 putative uncharacterized protein [Parachlamydia acanthamoebae UV-7]